MQSIENLQKEGIQKSQHVKQGRVWAVELETILFAFLSPSLRNHSPSSDTGMITLCLYKVLLISELSKGSIPSPGSISLIHASILFLLGSTRPFYISSQKSIKNLFYLESLSLLLSWNFMVNPPWKWIVGTEVRPQWNQKILLASVVSPRINLYSREKRVLHVLSVFLKIQGSHLEIQLDKLNYLSRYFHTFSLKSS